MVNYFFVIDSFDDTCDVNSMSFLFLAMLTRLLKSVIVVKLVKFALKVLRYNDYGNNSGRRVPDRDRIVDLDWFRQ